MALVVGTVGTRVDHVTVALGPRHYSPGVHGGGGPTLGVQIVAGITGSQHAAGGTVSVQRGRVHVATQPAQAGRCRTRKTPVLGLVARVAEAAGKSLSIHGGEGGLAVRVEGLVQGRVGGTQRLRVVVQGGAVHTVQSLLHGWVLATESPLDSLRGSQHSPVTNRLALWEPTLPSHRQTRSEGTNTPQSPLDSLWGNQHSPVTDRLALGEPTLPSHRQTRSGGTNTPQSPTDSFWGNQHSTVTARLALGEPTLPSHR